MTTPTPMELLDAGLKTTLVLALAGLLCRALRHASAATRHLVWTLAVAATLLLPSLRGLAPRWALPILPVGIVTSDFAGFAPAIEVGPPSAAPVLGDPASSRLSGAHPAPAVRGVPATPAAPPVTNAKHATWAPAGIDGPPLFLIVWLAGVLAVALPLLVGMVRMSWLGRRPLADASWSALALEIAASLGLRRSVRLVEGPAGSMPMAWGLLHPVVLLPEGAASWPEAKRRSVLTHELAHVRRHDCLTQALAHAACALYWFHPLVWLAARRLRVERELACDDLVLRSGASGPDYADQLLQLARFAREAGRPSWAAVAMARPSQLEGRLLAILDPALERRGLSRRGALALGAIAALLSVGLAGLSPWTGPALAARPLEAAEPEATPSASPANEAAPVSPSNAAGPLRAEARASEPTSALLREALDVEAPEAPEAPEEPEPAEGGPANAPSERVVAALAEALRDTDAEVRKQAVHSLGQLGAASAATALARALEEDAEPEVRAQAAFALGELRASGAAEALRKTLTADADAEVRQQAAFALGQLRDEGAVQALSSAVRDKEAEVRQQAVFALGELRATSAIPALTAAVQDADADVRQQAVFALGQIRAEGAVGPLIGALKDAQPDVREQAAFALGQIGSREGVAALIAALQDGAADVRQQAAFALGQLGDGRASEALAAALKDADVDVRKQAAFALGQLEN